MQEMYIKRTTSKRERETGNRTNEKEVIVKLEKMKKNKYLTKKMKNKKKKWEKNQEDYY